MQSVTSAPPAHNPVWVWARNIAIGFLVVVALIIAMSGRAAAQTAGVQGVVFLDANGNGVRDPGERGLAGVVVSDQDDVAATASDGLPR